MVRILCLALVAFATVAISPTQLVANPTIDVGPNYLQPNMANQQVQLFVTGGDLIRSEGFWFQIGDGGPDGPNHVINGPSITNTDLGTGTIFNAPDAIDVGALHDPQLWEAFHGATGAEVAAEGLIATLTISTVGWTSGSWGLNIFDTVKIPASYDTLSGSFDFAGSDGTITIIPEPATLTLLGSAFLVIGAIRLVRRIRRT